MRIYKWDTLTDQAARQVGNIGLRDDAAIYGIMQQLEQERPKPWRENAKNMILRAQAICDNWDVRKAKKLIELFPTLVAKKYRGQTPVAEYDAAGNWVLIFS